MKLVSVVIPVYNVEQYLNRCINSVICQTYQNIEILIIDDGSTDSSSKICDNFEKKDDRIRVIHQLNKGLSGARNTGIEIAKGQYIMFLDSDDYIAPFCIEKMIKYAIKYDADMVVGDFIKGSDFNYDFPDDNNDFEIIDGVTAINNIYKNNHSSLKFTVAWAKLYDIKLFNNQKYPEKKLFEDMFITYRLLFMANKIININARLVYYYQRSDSIMNQKYNIKKLDYLEALEQRIFFYFEHNLIELAHIAYDEYLHSLIWEYSRARDILHNKEIMRMIFNKYKKIYKFRYSSTRYINENFFYLLLFRINPELLVLKWKIDSKFNK